MRPRVQRTVTVVLDRHVGELLLGRSVLVHVALCEEREDAGERQPGGLFVLAVGGGGEDAGHRGGVLPRLGGAALDAADEHHVVDAGVDRLDGVVERVRRRRTGVLVPLDGDAGEADVGGDRRSEVGLVFAAPRRPWTRPQRRRAPRGRPQRTVPGGACCGRRTWPSRRRPPQLLACTRVCGGPINNASNSGTLVAVGRVDRRCLSTGSSGTRPCRIRHLSPSRTVVPTVSTWFLSFLAVGSGSDWNSTYLLWAPSEFRPVNRGLRFGWSHPRQTYLVNGKAPLILRC